MVAGNPAKIIIKDIIFMNIPFADLKAQYQSIKEEIDEAIKSVIENTAFIKGKYVQQFEEDYAEAYGVKHVVSCGNGTDAIYIALKAMDIGPGDEVITTAAFDLHIGNNHPDRC